MRNNLPVQQEVEERTNSLLQLGLKTYFSLKKQKQDELADLILARTSKMAEMELILSKIKYHKVYCGCGRQLRTGMEIEFFNKVGECLSCDHLKGEIAQEATQNAWFYENNPGDNDAEVEYFEEKGR